MKDYIGGVFEGEFKFRNYVIFASCFFVLMFLNFMGTDSEAMDLYMREAIEQRGKTFFLIEVLFPFVLLLGFLFIWVKVRHKQSITSLTTSRSKVDFRRFFFSFIIWGLFIIGTVLISFLTSPEEFKFNFQGERFLVLSLVAVLFIPIQTSFEEYFFRGYLMQGIGAKFKSKLIPLIFTSVVFGLMHCMNPEVGQLGYLIMIYYIGTGFFLGLVTLMDDGLELAMGFHCANNLLTALLVTSDWVAFQTDAMFVDSSQPSLVGSVFLPVLVFYPILLYFFSKKYKWNSFSKQLFKRVI